MEAELYSKSRVPDILFKLEKMLEYISTNHLHNLGIVEAFCRFCGAEEETQRHLLMDCGVSQEQEASVSIKLVWKTYLR